MNKTISIKNKDMATFVETKENISQYICSLIDADMKNDVRLSIIIQHINKALNEIDNLEEE